MTLDPPTQFTLSNDGNTFVYTREGVKVAFSTTIGNDSYYFATSEEFNRIKPAANVVSDFRVMDLAYNFDDELVQVVDRNVRIPAGYMIVRPWYPVNSLDLPTLLGVYPNSKSVW